MDRFAQLMGILMVVLAGYVAIVARPPLGDAVLRTVWPTRIDPLAIVTIVGGTVGGYITFAGAHRLVDAGQVGRGAVGAAVRSAALGISVATVMRVVLFLGALGIVAQGMTLDPDNPSAAVFRLAAGDIGYRLFGIVMWAAAITSVIGSAYTSVSFIPTGTGEGNRRSSLFIIGFIVLSTAIFLLIGRPVTVLILAGALNGLVLPLGLGAMLIAATRGPAKEAAGTPRWLLAAGAAVAIAMAVLGASTLVRQIPQLIARLG
jgi:Mn2+/Fe2+ NRAMP family transporter